MNRIRSAHAPAVPVTVNRNDIYMQACRFPQARAVIMSQASEQVRFQWIVVYGFGVREMVFSVGADFEIASAFHSYFEIIAADTGDLRDIAYRIRFNVYCTEFGWLDPLAHPDGREFDVCDAVSLHFLIRHRPTGEVAGCVRLVPGYGDGFQLPLEYPCRQVLDRKVVDIKNLAKLSYGEISRLAVVPGFRRRAGEKGTEAGNLQELEESANGQSRRFPHIAVGLYLAAAAAGLSLGMDRAFALMEPRLARRLRLLGLHFDQIGMALDYHGIRAPYQITRESLVSSAHPELLRLISDFQSQYSCALPVEQVCGSLPEIR